MIKLECRQTLQALQPLCPQLCCVIFLCVSTNHSTGLVVPSREISHCGFIQEPKRTSHPSLTLSRFSLTTGRRPARSRQTSLSRKSPDVGRESIRSSQLCPQIPVESQAGEAFSQHKEDQLTFSTFFSSPSAIDHACLFQGKCFIIDPSWQGALSLSSDPWVWKTSTSLQKEAQFPRTKGTTQ